MSDKVVEGHYQKETFTEIEYFPEHGERKETLEFRNSKKELEKVEHLGCYICKTMEHRESHHIIERATWNEIDVRKVAYLLYNHLDYHGHCHRDFKSHEELFNFFMQHYNGKYVGVQIGEPDEQGNVTIVQVATCDDEAADCIYNQLILCMHHHRDEGTSAHKSSFATFTAWMARREGVEISMSPKDFERMQMEHDSAKHGKANE